MKIICGTCSAILNVDEKKELGKLDPKYPAQTTTITCSQCGDQIIIQGRPIGHFKTSTGN